MDKTLIVDITTEKGKFVGYQFKNVNNKIEVYSDETRTKVRQELKGFQKDGKPIKLVQIEKEGEITKIQLFNSRINGIHGMFTGLARNTSVEVKKMIVSAKKTIKFPNLIIKVRIKGIAYYKKVQLVKFQYLVKKKYKKKSNEILYTLEKASKLSYINLTKPCLFCLKEGNTRLIQLKQIRKEHPKTATRQALYIYNTSRMMCCPGCEKGKIKDNRLLNIASYLGKYIPKTLNEKGYFTKRQLLYAIWHNKRMGGEKPSNRKRSIKNSKKVQGVIHAKVATRRNQKHARCNMDRSHE